MAGLNRAHTFQPATGTTPRSWELQELAILTVRKKNLRSKKKEIIDLSILLNIFGAYFILSDHNSLLYQECIKRQR